MPRIYTTLVALFVPVFAILTVIHLFDVANILALRSSWPFSSYSDPGFEDPGTAQAPPHFHQHSSSSHKDHAGLGSVSSGQVKGRFKRRIVAVGDLHGDIGNARKVLNMAGVVDKEGNWSGGVDFFVQTGDIIDRGDDTIKLYDWMDLLRGQAQEKGGTVLSHLGNHEWMNVIGKYVHASEIATFGTADQRMRMLMTGRIGKSWAANYSTTSRLPLHSSLGLPNTDYNPSDHSPLSHAAISFVHGGLAPNYPDLTPFPSRINSLGSSLLRKLQHQTPPPPPHPPHPYPGLPPSATSAEQGLYGTNGPLWYRGWALESEQKVCGLVDQVLQRTGTRRMIMGHTPDFKKIVSRCAGKIIIIDTGISHAYGGVLSALSIEYTLTPVSGKGDQRRWKEREVVSAVYSNHRDVLATSEREVIGDF
ncbi:Metallo-dependent phosphatase-like protein [Cytidiella melzeri]|nr:Metallo-dependent phosphatase-like protein [Cytidiella melzeri]